MPAVQVNNVASDILRFHDLTKAQSVNVEPESEYYDPTPEDLEDIRRAEDNRAKGRYYVMRDDETVEEFFDRIESDPEKWLECNLHKEKFL